MSLKVYVISSDVSESQNVRIDDYELVDVLGKKEESLAVQIEELLDSVVTSISRGRSNEGELTIEITGSISLKGEGGAKWLFFNVGGSTTKSDVMKVTFKTKIEPHNMHNQ